MNLVPRFPSLFNVCNIEKLGTGPAMGRRLINILSSKLIFLKGDHNLSENFTIQGGENFTKLTLASEGKLQQSRIHFGELVIFNVYGRVSNLKSGSMQNQSTSVFSVRSTLG